MNNISTKGERYATIPFLFERAIVPQAQGGERRVEGCDSIAAGVHPAAQIRLPPVDELLLWGETHLLLVASQLM